MRWLVALAAIVGLGLGGADAVQAQHRPMPHPSMNLHPPFYITNFYWHPCPYGIAGPTDPYGCPVDGIGPPPFGPRHWHTGAQGIIWHKYARSPRDFFMETPRDWR